jgi:hypothetical protein
MEGFVRMSNGDIECTLWFAVFKHASKGDLISSSMVLWHSGARFTSTRSMKNCTSQQIHTSWSWPNQKRKTGITSQHIQKKKSLASSPNPCFWSLFSPSVTIAKFPGPNQTRLLEHLHSFALLTPKSSEIYGRIGRKFGVGRTSFLAAISGEDDDVNLKNGTLTKYDLKRLNLD